MYMTFMYINDMCIRNTAPKPLQSHMCIDEKVFLCMYMVCAVFLIFPVICH